MTAARARLVALAAVVGATAAMGIAGASPASARTVPLTYDLGVVLPGQTRSIERTIDIPRDATVVSAQFADGAGGTGWDAQLCKEDDCSAVGDLTDAALAAGEYRLVVTLAMPVDATGVLGTSATGSLTLVDAGVDADAILPATGGTLPLAAGLVGGALAAGGMLLLLVGGGRRRRQVPAEARS
ncbi:MAG: hypothetical protein P0Y48_02995 [Candidatus Microbacterium phytovorans]|uniref:LPXTG cell wall anchor domain-containing protein n=1 Tax=Candidatus Microbacterium phytovorans TaxID=3121374 RepID=A0AAJ6B4I9_9MICO|nr:hypothetical protein [Microbacterium sp.]WEK14194.1 MAG: hypothetical protein P0Y48_02995 [Microbacterium sp.]